MTARPTSTIRCLSPHAGRGRRGTAAGGSARFSRVRLSKVGTSSSTPHWQRSCWPACVASTGISRPQVQGSRVLDSHGRYLAAAWPRTGESSSLSAFRPVDELSRWHIPHKCYRSSSRLEALLSNRVVWEMSSWRQPKLDTRCCCEVGSRLRAPLARACFCRDPRRLDAL